MGKSYSKFTMQGRNSHSKIPYTPYSPAIIKETFPLLIDPFFSYAKNVTFCDFTSYHLSRDYVQHHSLHSVLEAKQK